MTDRQSRCLKKRPGVLENPGLFHFGRKIGRKIGQMIGQMISQGYQNPFKNAILHALNEQKDRPK